MKYSPEHREILSSVLSKEDIQRTIKFYLQTKLDQPEGHEEVDLFMECFQPVLRSLEQRMEHFKSSKEGLSHVEFEEAWHELRDEIAMVEDWLKGEFEGDHSPDFTIEFVNRHEIKSFKDFMEK